MDVPVGEISTVDDVDIMWHTGGIVRTGGIRGRGIDVGCGALLIE